MKADRTVIVFGVFLFLVGLAVAWNGYGYVQVERGWTLVISGTIGFCTGLVLIALGLVLRELEAISSSAAKAALFLAKARSDAPRALSEPAVAEPLPTEPFPALAPELATVAEEAGAKPLSAAEEPPPEPPVAETPPPAPEAPAPKPPNWLSRAGTYAASFGSAKVKEDPFGAAPSADDNWIERAIAEEAATEAPYIPPGAHEPEPAEKREAVEAKAESAPATEPEPEPELAPKAEEALPAEATPGQTPAVVGHYEAQGARYTMYADGSIDAETAHGVYRFTSMEELKRFIEDSAG